MVEIVKSMDSYRSIKEELKKTNQHLLELLSELKLLPHVTENAFSAWEKTCMNIRKQMAEETIRVAVVGAIKSGKSTLTNALFGGDYLKRGAGVITSIVTKIRAGNQLTARLNFKSWEEINDEIDQALVLFPYLKKPTEGQRFEIRQKEARAALKKALETLGTDQLITNETRTTQSVVLSSYLNGYDRVSALLKLNNTLLEYRDADFEKHREFVGNESLAVFLKDLSLEIQHEQFESHIEIADCQGSDSPNPLHLAMIQDYLTKTHLIVYVVSSRTGLRQADIKFLSMIKKMGILDNALFVVNCDFSEHDSFENLKELIAKIEKDIILIQSNPEIFTFSALYQLLNTDGLPLSTKDRSKLAQWKKDKELAGFSKNEIRRFESALIDRIQRGRYRLLLKNHAERLWIAASGAAHWLELHHDLLTKDASGVTRIMERIDQHQNRAQQIKSIIKTTLDGAVMKLKHELKSDIDRFFDIRSETTVGRINDFIRNYKVNYSAYPEIITSSGFSGAMYQIFMDFKQELDTFIAESVNPEVIRFIKSIEEKIESYLESISDPFDGMVNDALAEYNRSIASLGMSTGGGDQPKRHKMNIQWIREVSGIRIPQADISMRYSARIRTEAVMHFGLFSVAQWIGKLMKKQVDQSKEKDFRALEKGVYRMKRETEKSISLHFMDYRENIKFQYLYKLTETASDHLYDALINRLQDYASNLQTLGRKVVSEQDDRIRTLDIIISNKQKAASIVENVNRTRESIEITI